MNWGPLSLPTTVPALLILTISALFVLAGLIWVEARRPNPRYLGLRIAAVTGAVLSLLMLVLQPEWRSTAKMTAALLTPGTDPEEFREFRSSAPPMSQVFSLDPKSNLRNVLAIPDLAYIRRNYPEVNRLHVFGYGLNDHDLRGLGTVEIVFHPSMPESGIQNIWWTRTVLAGEILKVQGQVLGNRGQLILAGPGGRVDSTQVDPAGRRPFELLSVPADTGRFLYDVILKPTEGEESVIGSIDVSVRAPEALTILVIEQAPGFETRYLKNWLAKQKNSVALRTTISRDRFRFEFLNHPEISLKNLTAKSLERFDLAIIDGRSLENLSTTERRQLRAAIADDGLGLLISADEAVLDAQKHQFADRPFYLSFRFDEFTDIEYRSVRLKLRHRWAGLSTEISAEPFAIKAGIGLQPVVKDDTGQILVAAYRRGKGMIGTNLIRNSFRWILAGESRYHAGFWSQLISELARKDRSDAWTIAPGPVLKNRPLDLNLTTDAANPEGLVGRESHELAEVYLQQDKVNRRRWSGRYWPRADGWHRVATKGMADPLWFYSHQENTWQSWQQNQKLAATKRFAEQSSVSSAAPVETSRQQPVPLLWFFLLFLACSGFLWLERKV